MAIVGRPVQPWRPEMVTRDEASQIAVAFRIGFDDAAYDRMGSDRQRVDQYTQAIAKAVPGKVVLDIGTGRDALLAQICARFGAKRVIAVEVVSAVAAQARVAVAKAGLQDRIEVLEGHTTAIALPHVDLVVHEIVGSLACEEGMGPVMADLQNRPDVVNARQPGWSLPCYVETRIAPVAMREPFLTASDFRAGVVELPVNRMQRIPAPHPQELLGSLQVLDALDVMLPVEPQLLQERVLRWRINEAAVLSGFACAPWLKLDGGHAVDAWLGGTSWQHKLVGLTRPVLVKPGDEVTVRATCKLRRFPSRYGFSVELLRREQVVTLRAGIVSHAPCHATNLGGLRLVRSALAF